MSGSMGLTRSMRRLPIPPALPRALHWLNWRTGQAMRLARKVRKPRILTYHAIGPADTPAALFSWQIRTLREEFELISLSKLVERLASGRVTGDEIAITFDDGVRNHATHAYPLLLEQRVPATFFVCPGLVDSGRWIWNMELRTRLRLLPAHERIQLARSIGAGSGNVEDLIRWSKTLALDDRQELEARARARTTQFEPSAQQLDRFAPMTWEQARGMDARLINFGSHTISHPILTALPGAEQEHEISGSRQLLENRLGRSTDLFCYPNGAVATATMELVRATYRAAVTTRPAFVEREDAPHLLPRIHAGQFAGLFLRRLHRPGA